MSNVRPGNMARVLPPALGAGSIVEVVAEITPFEYEFCAQAGVPHKGTTWNVKLMNGSKANYVGLRGEAVPNYLLPGDVAMCPDAYLKRIDPLADEEDAFREHAVEDEVAA